jgi:phage baseplate assembly protein W
VPGWEIIKDKNNMDPHARVIRFHEPLRTDDDIFEVSYHTVRGVCRRCMGLGIENDFRHDRKGDPIFVENQRLLLQEVEKIVFTVKGSNLFHRWYGTSISELIGTKIVGGGQYVETQLVTEVSDALERYKQIKEQQSRYQPVSRKEMLQRIVSIEVKQDKYDATVFDVSIVLESQSGELEQITDTLLVGDASFAQGFQRVK